MTHKFSMNQRVTALIWAFPYGDFHVTITGTICGIKTFALGLGGCPVPTSPVWYRYSMCRDAGSNESGWKYVSNSRTEVCDIPEEIIWPADDPLRFASFVGRLVLES